MQQKYVVDKEKCSGCLACKDICPVNAINVKIDEEGFKYPEIDEHKCIKCGKCSRLCAFKRENLQPSKHPIDVIGTKLKDEKERITSRSGGMFISIANQVLKENGVVYGCKIEKNLEVCHSRATTKEEIDMFKGSKYVKSNLKDVYMQVKEDLKNKKKVLFSGTACEIAGLNMVLNNSNTENLLTCDIICFGVPSPLIYMEFIKFMEEKEKSQIININFRDKKYGWSTCQETITYEDKEKTTNYYANLFFSKYALRPSCYNCSFCNLDRVSDITIGDFWGIEKEKKEFNDEKGVSIVLLNTEKGTKMWNKIKCEHDWFKVQSENYIQPHLRCPTEKPNDREKFWNDYKEKKFDYIMEKYAEYKE